MAKLDLKNLPVYAKIILSLLPAIIITALAVMMFIMPKQERIKELDAKIDEQNNQIAVSQAKGAKLEILIKENERLLERLNELKEYLPEEKEISSLLKQVSDLSIAAGLQMKSWRPAQKKTHPSGFVYEIPVSVSVNGTYHNFGNFLSSLTRLNRIVNISNISVAGAQLVRGTNVLQITFIASTFSAIPEGEAVQK
jgi:type IV pilus assembly protein PilO